MHVALPYWRRLEEPSTSPVQRFEKIRVGTGMFAKTLAATVTEILLDLESADFTEREHDSVSRS